MTDQVIVTCECAPNIALVKYWGKADQELILPLNGSLSVTLDTDVLCSKTSLIILKNPVENSKKIQIWFDDLKQEFNETDGPSKEKELISKKRFL